MSCQLEDDLRNRFSAELADIDSALEIYRALCNQAWQGPERTYSFTWRSAAGLVAGLRNEIFSGSMAADRRCLRCQRPAEEHHRENYTVSFFGQPLEATRLTCCQRDDQFLPDNRGREDYMDFYCSGGEGQVAEWFRERMAELGYRATIKPGPECGSDD